MSAVATIVPALYNEQSVFFFRFIEGSARARASVGRRSRETRKTRAAAREGKESSVSFSMPLPSRAFSLARVYLRVSRVLLDAARKKERLLVV